MKGGMYMKYNVGDRVMVISEDYIKATFKETQVPYCPYQNSTGIGFNIEMMKVCGLYVTIKSVDTRLGYRIEEAEGWWVDSFFVEDSLAPTKMDEYRKVRRVVIDKLGKEIERITKLVDESEGIQLQYLEEIRQLDDKIEAILLENVYTNE